MSEFYVAKRTNVSASNHDVFVGGSGGVNFGIEWIVCVPGFNLRAVGDLQSPSHMGLVGAEVDSSALSRIFDLKIEHRYMLAGKSKSGF